MKLGKKIGIAIQSWLVLYALYFQYTTPLHAQDYKSGLHFLFAQIMDILGEYRLEQLFVYCLIVVMILWVKKSEYQWFTPRKRLPLFFSACLMIGGSMAAAGSLDGILQNPYVLLKAALAFFGYTILLFYLLTIMHGLYQKAGISRWKPRKRTALLGDRGILPVWGLLLAVWAPVILLSYPGNLCYDGLGSISQGLGDLPYTSHHPLLYTLFLTALVKLGQAVTGGLNAGVFLSILLQALMLSAALSATIVRLAKRQVSYCLRTVTLLIYLFSPMYSNMVSTVLKDIPFMAAFLWYMLLLEECVHIGFDELKPKDLVKLCLVSGLVGLLRKNGIYVVALTGIIVVLVWAKRLHAKKALLTFLIMTVLPLLLCFVGNEIMVRSLNAQKGSVAEMLSVPFQQTARYLQLYRSELSSEERQGIEAVLGDVDKVAMRYDPASADAVKALFVQDAQPSELFGYMKVWLTGFFRHPKVYVEAFLIHVYGWFDPAVVNSIRYEAVSELFPRNGLFPNANKVLVFWYRGLSHIPFIEILENVGAYTWCLFLLAGFARKRKDRRGILLVPLFISLLICMASPCFYLHPRYAYPIMFTIPFLLGTLGTKAAERPEESMEERV